MGATGCINAVWSCLRLWLARLVSRSQPVLARLRLLSLPPDLLPPLCSVHQLACIVNAPPSLPVDACRSVGVLRSLHSSSPSTRVPPFVASLLLAVETTSWWVWWGGRMRGCTARLARSIHSPLTTLALFITRRMLPRLLLQQLIFPRSALRVLLPLKQRRLRALPPLSQMRLRALLPLRRLRQRLRWMRLT